MPTSATGSLPASMYVGARSVIRTVAAFPVSARVVRLLAVDSAVAPSAKEMALGLIDTVKSSPVPRVWLARRIMKKSCAPSTASGTSRTHAGVCTAASVRVASRFEKVGTDARASG